MKLVSKRALHMTYRDIGQQYKQARKIEFKLGYRHKPRWRKISQMSPRYRRFNYVMFGPGLMEWSRLK